MSTVDSEKGGSPKRNIALKGVSVPKYEQWVNRRVNTNYKNNIMQNENWIDESDICGCCWAIYIVVE